MKAAAAAGRKLQAAPQRQGSRVWGLVVVQLDPARKPDVPQPELRIVHPEDFIPPLAVAVQQAVARSILPPSFRKAEEVVPPFDEAVEVAAAMPDEWNIDPSFDPLRESVTEDQGRAVTFTVEKDFLITGGAAGEVAGDVYRDHSRCLPGREQDGPLRGGQPVDQYERALVRRLERSDFGAVASCPHEERRESGEEQEQYGWERASEWGLTHFWNPLIRESFFLCTWGRRAPSRAPRRPAGLQPPGLPHYYLLE